MVGGYVRMATEIPSLAIVIANAEERRPESFRVTAPRGHPKHTPGLSIGPHIRIIGSDERGLPIRATVGRPDDSGRRASHIDFPGWP
jgi:hypothetical protein